MRVTVWHSSLAQILLCFAVTHAVAQNTSPNSAKAESLRFHFEAAQAAMRKGNPQMAAAEYRAVLNMDKQNVEALVDLGVIYFFQGD